MGRITFRASSPDATSRFVPVTLEDDIELHEDFEHRYLYLFPPSQF